MHYLDIGNILAKIIYTYYIFPNCSDSSAEDGGLSDEIRLPLEEAFGDEVSGDVVPAPAPLPQRAPAPVVEPETDHMSAVEELVEALARPFTVSTCKLTVKSGLLTCDRFVIFKESPL